MKVSAGGSGQRFPASALGAGRVDGSLEAWLWLARSPRFVQYFSRVFCFPLVCHLGHQCLDETSKIQSTTELGAELGGCGISHAHGHACTRDVLC